MRFNVTCLVGGILLSVQAAMALVQMGPADSARVEEKKQFHFGVGISIEPSVFGMQNVYIYQGDYYGPQVQPAAYAEAPVNIYFPVFVTERLRLEPVFGYYAYSNEQTVTWHSSNPSTVPSSSVTKNQYYLIHIGLRLHALFPIVDHFKVYLGPEAGYLSQKTVSGSTNYDGTYEGSTTTPAYLIAFSSGGEYLPLSAFSVGGEFTIRYLWHGNPESSSVRTPPPVQTSWSEVELKRTYFSTGVLFFVRWYFF